MTRRQHWAAFSLAAEKEVRRVAEDVYYTLGEPPGYERVWPHVTVHPGFTAGGRCADEVASVLRASVGSPVRLGPVEYWPSPDEPHVVKLPAEVNLSPVREAVSAAVEGHGGTEDREPVPAHATLIKSTGGGEPSLSSVGREQLSVAAHEAGGPLPLETEVSGYRLEARL